MVIFSFRQILEFMTPKLVIIVDNTYIDHVYEFDLTSYGAMVHWLQIKGACCTGKDNANLGDSILRLWSGRNHLLENHRSYYLGLFNLRIRGDLSVGSNQMFQLVMENVEFQPSEQSNELNLQSSANFHLYVRDSILNDAFLNVASKDSAELRLENVSMRQIRATEPLGFLAQFSGRDKGYYVGIKNSSFHNITSPCDRLSVFGALAIETSGGNSRLKLFIEHSTFNGNSRAVDLAISGETDLYVSGSMFTGNIAHGPGGAVRIASSAAPGIGGHLPDVDKLHVTLDRCQFDSNAARSSSLDGNVGTSPGDGGAVYVQVSPPSMHHPNNLVLIRQCSFRNNSATSHGGTLFLGSGVSCVAEGVDVSNPPLFVGGETTNVLRAAGAMRIDDMNVQVSPPSVTDGAVIAYKSTEIRRNSIRVNALSVLCPRGFTAAEDHANAASDEDQFDALQIYCRPCPFGRYVVRESRAEIRGALVRLEPAQSTCRGCPHGATCRRGIRNNQNFWGAADSSGLVHMYLCPDGYCAVDDSRPVAISTCAAARRGTLCGRCATGFSESLWGTGCIANSRCRSTGGWLLTLALVYGVIYLLFCGLHERWCSLLQQVASTLSCGKRPRRFAYHLPTVNTGYLQILLYFVQTASLLSVDVVLVNGVIHKQTVNPHDILHPFLVTGIQKVLPSGVRSMEMNSCLIPDLTPGGKITVKLTFFTSLYATLLLTLALGRLCSLNKGMRSFAIR